MSIKIKQSHQKEIVALDTFEAVRLRPGMYVGQVAPMEEKLPLIVDGKLKSVEKTWSSGFMHLIVEVLENALDEGKRCNGKMEKLNISVNLDNNEIVIQDTGNGFYNAHTIHQKTNKSVVRTALEDLHAGSNFTDNDSNILGTHGVGAAVTNILSQNFSCETINKDYYVKYEWEDFKVVNEVIRKKKRSEKLGTTITFTPSPEVFKGYKWDKDIIVAYLSQKQFLIKNDPVIKNLKMDCKFITDGKKTKMELFPDFLPDEVIKVESPLGMVCLWPSYEDSCSISFVNGSRCVGIHQKIINDWCNVHFGYNLAHHFYETMIMLNVPSTLMRFDGQNKFKYAITRPEIEEQLVNSFYKKLIRLLKKSDIGKTIENKIEDRLHSENINKIKRAQKQSKRKISEKYSPPSKTKEVIYITEGLSAAGSVKQARDSEYEGVYALKGKVKNTRKLSDLTNNKEILEIMGILNIEPDNDKQSVYEKIVIAADEDADGQHISSLIINFFYKWFPHIVKDKRLYKLITPLVACNYGKDRHYFYTMEEFQDFSKSKKVTNLTYLKGLGSLSLEDWKYVMENKVLFSIMPDGSAKRYLDIAFGASSQKRKKWLEGKK